VEPSGLVVTVYALHKMRVLITGASGMLGVDVQAVALAAGHEVVALTRADLDISDLAAVEAAVTDVAPEIVINCAAYTKVDDAEADGRDAAHLTNGVAPGHLAGAAATAGAWIVHVSTDYVFDGAKTTGPYLESDATAPQSVYGASKLEGELAIAQAAPLSHTIVRSSWLFGNHGSCFPATMLRLASTHDSLSVVSDQRGCPTFTPDLAMALLTVASQQLLGVVHIAGGGECSWYDFARETITRAGLGAVVTPCTTADFPRPAPRPAYSVLRSGHSDAPVLRDWREGLREYLEAREPTEAPVL
jgi:dTDP-4-dehydrorhamnose reductase